MEKNLKNQAYALQNALTLTPRQLCDLEMILVGAFAPLDGFLAADDYESCVRNKRLANGSFWPIPISLDVSEEFAARVKEGSSVGGL